MGREAPLAPWSTLADKPANVDTVDGRPDGSPPRFAVRRLLRTDTDQRPGQGNANTKSVLPSLGRSSGVMRLNIADVSDWPVLTATYCRPPAA